MFPPDSLPHFLPNSKSVDPVSPFGSGLFLTYLQPTLREGMCNTPLCPEAAPVPVINSWELLLQDLLYSVTKIQCTLHSAVT